MKQILGVHVYEKRGPIEWEEELLAVTLLSVLSWKRFHGRIHLYTNEEYLETLRKWGIDKLYDKIDTDTLKQIPDRLNQKEYWAFGKIHVAGEIDEPFVLVDNDLWINSPLQFDERNSFTAYHFENFDENFPLNPYVDFDNLIPPKWLGRWRKDIMPVNTALLWINNNNLKNEWVETAKEIALQTDQVILEDPHNSKKMVLVEQRILPMIAFERNLRYNTFIYHIYQSHLSGYFDGSEWDPHVKDWNQKERTDFEEIRHIWGGKRFFESDMEFRKAVFDCILRDFDPYPEKEDFKELLSKLIID
jgi:hypothetical protein